MTTELLPFSDRAIDRAVELLAAEQPVAFPTETVYGLGARIARERAVQGVYEAKGRPRSKPLIIHVADVASARGLAADWSDAAERLAQSFWPGPLTLVVARSVAVPLAAAAGGNTIAVRAPAHPVAQQLLAACDFVIAAPSANPSGAAPPTTAEQVLEGLAGRIPLIIDGGATTLGTPSTIVDGSGGKARLIRAGAINRPAIDEVVALG